MKTIDFHKIDKADLESIGYAAASLVRPSGQLAASCRVIDATVSGGGQATSTQRYSACRDNRGEWQLTQA